MLFVKIQMKFLFLTFLINFISCFSVKYLLCALSLQNLGSSFRTPSFCRRQSLVRASQNDQPPAQPSSPEEDQVYLENLFKSLKKAERREQKRASAQTRISKTEQRLASNIIKGNHLSFNEIAQIKKKQLARNISIDLEIVSALHQPFIAIDTGKRGL